MRLKGKLGGGFETVNDEPVAPRKHMLSITGTAVDPEPLERWVLANCPAVRDFALASRADEQKPSNPRKRPGRHLVAFVVAAEGFGAEEAEEALKEVLARIKPRHRPKRLSWVKFVPRVGVEQGGGYDRMRLRKQSVEGRKFFYRTGERAGRGPTMTPLPVSAALNEWRFEGFLKWNPISTHSEDPGYAVSMSVAHIDSATGEERRISIYCVGERMVTKAKKLKGGCRIAARGHIGSFGRMICERFTVISDRSKRVAFDDTNKLIEALV